MRPTLPHWLGRATMNANGRHYMDLVRIGPHTCIEVLRKTCSLHPEDRTRAASWLDSMIVAGYDFDEHERSVFAGPVGWALMNEPDVQGTREDLVGIFHSLAIFGYAPKRLVEQVLSETLKRTATRADSEFVTELEEVLADESADIAVLRSSGGGIASERALVITRWLTSPLADKLRAAADALGAAIPECDEHQLFVFSGILAWLVADGAKTNEIRAILLRRLIDLAQYRSLDARVIDDVVAASKASDASELDKLFRELRWMKDGRASS